MSFSNSVDEVNQKKINYSVFERYIHYSKNVIVLCCHMCCLSLSCILVKEIFQGFDCWPDARCKI